MKNKAVIFLLYLFTSLAIGILAAFLYYLYFLQFIPMSNLKSWLALLYLVVLFSCLVLFIIYKFVLPRLRTYLPLHRIFGITGSLLVGIWLAFAIPLPIPMFFPSPHTLEIIPTGQKNALSQGTEVWIIGLYFPNGEQVPDSEFSLVGDWEIRDSKLLSYKNQPATLYWKGNTPGDLHLKILSHAWSGKVKLIWDDRIEFMDLFSDVDETKEIIFEVNEDISPWFSKFLGYVGDGMLIGFILLIIILWMGSHYHNNRNKKYIMNAIQIFRKYFKLNYLITFLIIPIALLTLYSGSFAYLSSQFLPAGVNFVFVSRLWKYSLILLFAVCFIGILLYKLYINEKVTVKKSTTKIFSSDLIFLFLPLTPVVQYIVNNQSILSPLDSLFVIVFFLLFSAIYIFTIPAFIGFVSSTRMLIMIGLAFIVTLLNMASLSLNFHWFERGSFKIQLGYLIAVFIASWFLLSINNKKALSMILIIYFVANSGFQLLSNINKLDAASLPTKENQLQSMVKGRIPVITPNIYLLIYDAYVGNETMLGYGINNSSQEELLIENGFVIYPHTYSIGADTLSSMEWVLQASTDVDGYSRKAVSGDGIVQNTLKKFGYKTYGLFPNDYLFRGIGSSYDFSFPAGVVRPYALLISAILLGEFKYDIGFSDEQFHAEFVDTKQSIIKNASTEQIFVYSHSDFPGHSQNSGVCLSNEIDLYRKSLLAANDEMQQDIETIIDYDPNAIVIVAGDHGPYLTKNCTVISDFYDISEISRLDIQDRYGLFLAIRWPTEDFENFDDITVLQDIFPSTFAYLFNDTEFSKLKVKPQTPDWGVIGAVVVKNGIIYGGINDGESLFISGN